MDHIRSELNLVRVPVIYVRLVFSLCGLDTKRIFLYGDQVKAQLCRKRLQRKQQNSTWFVWVFQENGDIEKAYFPVN
jgi:hypothetical protein